jgi:hypothetical protein
VAGKLTPRRPTRSTLTSRPMIGVEVVAVVVLMGALLMQGSLFGPPGATPVPSSATASGGPVASPSAGTGTSPEPSATATGNPTPSPTPDTDAGWASLDLAPITRIASLEADRVRPGGVAPDASFTLASLTGEPAAAIAARLTVTPTVKLAVASGSNAAHARVTPATKLQPSTAYRFTLRNADGSLAGSWAFQVRGPVRVLSTLPGDRVTGVPVSTGIELTFDQDGVADMADHFTISPKVAGRFERHGRTQVFVPASPLKFGTIYTVKVTRGLARVGTDLILGSDVVVAFETETQGQAATRDIRVEAGRLAIEASPAEAPVLAVWVVDPDPDDSIKPPSTVRVRAYRVPSVAAARTMLSDYLAAPTWAESIHPTLPTKGLKAVATFTAKLTSNGEGNADRVIRFPEPLAKGIYVVEVGAGKPSYAFLQVTPVSAWTSVLTDRTVVWVNDVVTHRPIKGATVALTGKAPFGTSDADGLVQAPTPDALIPPAEAEGRTVPDVPPFLEISSPAGDRLLLPFGLDTNGDAYRGEWWETWSSGDATYWSVLDLDRDRYRTSDTVGVWGFLRGRDDGSIPSRVEVRMVTAGSPQSPPIVSATVVPGKGGTWLASLTYAHAPIGPYEVQALVDGRTIASTWIDVAVIRKPAYQLDVTPDHTAVIAGSTVSFKVAASFFDGSPVPGVSLAWSVSGADGSTVSTGADGTATVKIKAVDNEPEGESQLWFSVRPAGGEYGNIWAERWVTVFPAAIDIQGRAAVQDARLRIDGSVHEVDLAKVERSIGAGDGGWDGDAAGDPVGGVAVRAVVTELIPVRTKVGTDYDYIEKVARARYEYSTKRSVVRTLTLTSRANGAFSAAVAVPDPKHEYEIVLTGKDAAGRTERRTISSGWNPEWWATSGVRFATPAATPLVDTAYAVGERISWRMTSDGRGLPSGGANRYLYLVAQLGLRSATVTSSPVFEHRMAAADAPGVFVIGVRFTGSTYAPKASSWADLDTDTRKLTVEVKADRASYRPGDTVSLSVRVRDAKGDPVATSLVVQAVDEKLYAMHAASVEDPLWDLYSRVDSGIVRLTASHQQPSWAGREGEGGDTSGGGEVREDFRDRLLFRDIKTGSDGRASTTMRLSDDLTAWHVVAAAVSPDLEGGVGEVLVPVGLPFFVDPVVADEFLLGDRPSIGLRAFGQALKRGDRVDFTVEAPTLGLKATTVRGKAFETTSFALPRLAVGTHQLVVSAKAVGRTGADGAALRDAVRVPVRVVPTRLTTQAMAFVTLPDDMPTVASDGLATYTFADAGRGRYLGRLLELAEPGSLRVDRGIADVVAHDLLVEAFGVDPATLPPVVFDPSAYPITEASPGTADTTGLALLPYGGGDPWLAARVAVLGPGRLGDDLRRLLWSLASDTATKRDLAIAATAGLAALGEPVLDDLQTLAGRSDLTITERLYLALGLEAAGDDPGALAIERALLEQNGQRLGSWIRIRIPTSTADTYAATALLSVVAAGLGDPLADGMADFVEANQLVVVQADLELAAMASRAIERMPASSASLAYTVDGKRTVVDLGPGESRTIELTPQQRQGFAAERISGAVSVTVSWRTPVEPSSVKTSSDLSLARTVPSGVIPTGRLVTVDLKATFAAHAPTAGCYEVTELVPSGLAPLDGLSEAPREDDSPGRSPIYWPASTSGQVVTFCIPNEGSRKNPVRMRYRARVVDAGTYVWEPAMIQLPGGPELVALTPSATGTIGVR